MLSHHPISLNVMLITWLSRQPIISPSPWSLYKQRLYLILSNSPSPWSLYKPCLYLILSNSPSPWSLYKPRLYLILSNSPSPWSLYKPRLYLILSNSPCFLSPCIYSPLSSDCKFRCSLAY